MRGRGCCDSSLDMGLGNMGHVGEAVGQLLVGMDGVHSGGLGEAALRGLGRRSRWQRRRCACQGPWVVQILLGLSAAQVWGLPRLVLDRAGGRMLGLRLAPRRRGGRLRLVGMERCGMMWVGLMDSGIEGLRGGLLCRWVLRSRGRHNGLGVAARCQHAGVALQHGGKHRLRGVVGHWLHHGRLAWELLWVVWDVGGVWGGSHQGRASSSGRLHHRGS